MAVDSLDGGWKLEHKVDVDSPYLAQQKLKPCENGTLEDMLVGCIAFTSS